MLEVPENKIACQPLHDSDMTPGGLYIPDIAKERVDQGIVKYIGKNVKDIKVGDYIMFSGYVGTYFLLEGEGELIILPEDFVTCRIESPVTDIPGLYFRDMDGEYFTATYEQILLLVARAFESTEFYTRLRVNYEDKFRDRPTEQDYEKLKGG